MITVYLDESGQSERNSIMVLAGFWGNKEQWDALVPDWVSCLGKRKSLHMKTLRLNSKTGAARGKILLDRLGPLPHKHKLTPLFAAVKVSDYSDLIEDTKSEREFTGYRVCLVAVMQRLSKYIPAHESIKLVCEDQHEYEIPARQAFRQVRVTPPISSPDRPYFSGIEFIPKHSSVLTEPSDFLAYAIAEGYNRGVNSRKAKLCKPIIGPSGQVYGLLLEREWLRRTISKWKAISAQRGY
jgi:hypothetical protein